MKVGDAVTITKGESKGKSGRLEREVSPGLWAIARPLPQTGNWGTYPPAAFKLIGVSSARYCMKYAMWTKERVRPAMRDRAAKLLDGQDSTDTLTVAAALSTSTNTAVKCLLECGYLLVDGDSLLSGRWEYAPEYSGGIEIVPSDRRKPDGSRIRATTKHVPVTQSAPETTEDEWWDVPELKTGLDELTVASLQMAGIELRVQARRVK